MKPQLTETELLAIVETVKEEMLFQGKRHGMGIFWDDAQIDGRMAMEMREYRQAIDSRSSDQEKIDELLDIAVCALWGAASIRNQSQSLKTE